MKDTTFQKVQEQLPLTRKEQKEVEEAQRQGYKDLRKMGYDSVSNSVQARFLRDFQLRKIKRFGLFQTKETSLSNILFPASRPVAYITSPGVSTMLEATGNLLQSKKNLAMYDISDHPAFANTRYAPFRPTTMGAKLEGYGAAFKQMPFNFVAKRPVPCTPIVTTEIVSAEDLGFFRQLVEEQYRIHFQLDGLPVLMRSKEYNYAVKGMPVGFQVPRNYKNMHCLYNHFKFTVTYHEDSNKHEGIYITGFDIHPVSIIHDDMQNGRIQSCRENKRAGNNRTTYLTFDHIETHKTVTFSYEIEWVPSRDLKWEDRWDVYFVGMPDNDIHYDSIYNSVMCVLTVAAIIARALYRTFRRDMAGGSKKDNGWKQVHGDVFRLPHLPMVLAVLVGNGLHLLVTTILTMVLNVLGFISTMEMGEVLNGFVLLYALCGLVGGNVSARVYKLCGGKNCRRNALLTCTWPSGFILIVFVLFNQLSSMIGSSADWFGVLELLVVWACVLVPLALLGAKRGDRTPRIDFPTRTSNDVRRIPKSKWARFKWLAPFMSGMMTFSVFYVELYFVMIAIWYRQSYIGLGYLLTQTLLAMILCAEFSICICYLQLNAEDHQWWWTSILSGAGAGVYFALYTFMYWSHRLELVGWYSNLSFLACMLLASLCVSIAFGSIGFLSCLCFTRWMYSTMTCEDDEETSNGK